MRAAPNKPVVGERTHYAPIPAQATPVAADASDRKAA
jgi:hypothetical protein